MAPILLSAMPLDTAPQPRRAPVAGPISRSTTNNDHWNADHCIDPAAVPGVIFYQPRPGRTFLPLIQGYPPTGHWEDDETRCPPVYDELSEEDQEAVEDRLKGLGYL